MPISKAREIAANEKMDLVLKTSSTQKPVVQISSYRVNLLKDFYMKHFDEKANIAENMKDEDFNLVEIRQQIGLNDLKTKAAMVRRMVQKEKAAVRIFVRVKPSSKIDIAKANFLLQNMEDQLEGVGTILKKNTVQKFTRDLPQLEAPETLKEVLEKEPQIDVDEEDAQIDDVDLDREKLGEEARVQDEKEIGYVALEVIPQMQEETRSQAEAMLKNLGSIDNIMQKIEERRGM